MIEPASLSYEAIKIDEYNMSVPVSKKQRTINHSVSKDSDCSLPRNRKRLTINCTEEGTPKSLTREVSREALHSLTLNTSTNKESTNEQRLNKYSQQK